MENGSSDDEGSRETHDPERVRGWVISVIGSKL